MPARVAVVIPWQDTGCEHRAAALAWVTAQYMRTHPSWPIVLSAPPLGPWCKAAAVTPAVAAADADIVIVADADVWTTGTAAAVASIEAGAPWAIPHTNLYRLTREATADVVNGAEPDLRDIEIDRHGHRRPYVGYAGGGTVIALRDTLLDVPLDPRFVGWGQEDMSWALALACLRGQPVRQPDDMVHLWHPPQQRANRKIGSLEGKLLHRRYTNARRDPCAMRALLDEVTDVDRDAHQPAVHAHPPHR